MRTRKRCDELEMIGERVVEESKVVQVSRWRRASDANPPPGSINSRRKPQGWTSQPQSLPSASAVLAL